MHQTLFMAMQCVILLKAMYSSKPLFETLFRVQAVSETIFPAFNRVEWVAGLGMLERNCVRGDDHSTPTVAFSPVVRGSSARWLCRYYSIRTRYATRAAPGCTTFGCTSEFNVV